MFRRKSERKRKTKYINSVNRVLKINNKKLFIREEKI